MALSNLELEKKVIKEITRKDKTPFTFEQLVKEFDKKILKFDPINNSFKINDYFKHGVGPATLKKLLQKDGKIKQEWLYQYKTKGGKEKLDFKGLYVFLHNDIPFYVGISKGVIGRLEQHLKGKNHYTSTLAYKIAVIRKQIKDGKEYRGTREGFNFPEEVEPAKEFLLRQKVAFLNITNDEELYLFEVYASLKLKTWLNAFLTH